MDWKWSFFFLKRNGAVLEFKEVAAAEQKLIIDTQGKNLKRMFVCSSELHSFFPTIITI